MILHRLRFGFVLCMLVIFTSVRAVADDYEVGISVSVTDAECGNDGKIDVTLSGADAHRLTDITYSANEKSSNSGSIGNLPAGDYVVKMNGRIGDDPVERTATAHVGGVASYDPLNVIVRVARPALPDMQSGIFEVSFSGGKTPLYIEVRDTANNNTVYIDTLDNIPNTLLIDSIPDGVYSLKFSDGCSSPTFPGVQIPRLDNSFNCNLIDFGISGDTVFFNLFRSAYENAYYYEHIADTGAVWWEFMYGDGTDTSQWEDVPANGRSPLLSANKFCDIWGNGYIVKVRVKGRSDLVCQRAGLSVEPPAIKNGLYYPLNGEDGCVLDTMLLVWPETPGYAGSRFYSLPLRLSVKNLSAGSTVSDTTLKTYNWQYSVRLAGATDGDTIRILATDAHGCRIDSTDTVLHIVPVKLWRVWSNSDPCNLNYMGINSLYRTPNGEYISLELRNGLTVELVEAPRPDLCFSISYDQNEQRWVGAENRPNVKVEGSTVMLIDTAPPGTASLPSGRYVWHITVCGRTDTVMDSLNFYRYTRRERLRVDSSAPSCSGLRFFPQNNVVRERLTATGFDAPEPAPCRFSVCSTSEPPGHVRMIDDRVNGGYFEISPAENTGSPTFSVQSYYDGSICPQDTVALVYRRPPTLSLTRFGGYRCDPASPAVIEAEVDSATGIAPYLFTLYAEDGTQVAANNSGKFSIPPAGTSTYRLKVTDGCGSSAAMYSEAWRNIDVLQVGFGHSIVGQNLTRLLPNDALLYACEGNTDTLSVRVNLGSILWTLPNGSTSSARKIPLSFTGQGSLDTGWFRVEIDGLQCPIDDSARIALSRPVRLSADTTLCRCNLPDTILGFVVDKSESSGQLVYRGSTAFGCDSTITLNLTIDESYDETFHIAICTDALPYTFADTTFDAGTTSGTYVLRRVNRNGCDSIIRIDLSVNPAYRLTDTATLCSADLPWTYGNREFPAGTTSGTYTVAMRTAAGCDSVVALTLTVNPSYHTRETLDLMPEDLPYRYRDSVFVLNTPSGDYRFAYVTQAGCDSLFTVSLRIGDTIEAEIPSLTVCADQPEASLRIALRRGQPTFYSLAFAHAPIHAFADIDSADFPDGNVANIALPMPPSIRPNTYSAHLTLGHFRYRTPPIPLTLTVLYPAKIMLQKWNDVIALFNENYNGGYVFAAYQWRRDEQPISGAVGPYLYCPPALDFGADYSVMLTRTDDGVSLPTCPLRPVPKTDVSLYPTLLRAGEPISLALAESSTVSICNLSGKTLSRAAMPAGSISIAAPAKAGLYFVEISSSAGARRVIKIVVQ